MKFVVIFFLLASALLAVDLITLPSVTGDLKVEASEYYNNECKGCHRWARKFAAPPMKENVESYKNKPAEMVEYLMHPTPKNPDQWPPMEIAPLNLETAKMMTSWLLYILQNPDDSTKPK